MTDDIYEIHTVDSPVISDDEDAGAWKVVIHTWNLGACRTPEDAPQSRQAGQRLWTHTDSYEAGETFSIALNGLLRDSRIFIMDREG